MKIGKKMQVSHLRLIAMLLMMAGVSACSDDDGPQELEMTAERVFPGVDERLWPLFIRFEDQAAERGVTISLADEGITGVIEPIDRENVAGSCNFNSRVPNHVMVDEEFWNNVPDLFKEFIVFHELGHCSLFRDHRESADEQGRCVSIMRSGVGTCSDNYNLNTRPLYLDELFDPEFANNIFAN